MFVKPEFVICDEIVTGLSVTGRVTRAYKNDDNIGVSIPSISLRVIHISLNALSPRYSRLKGLQ
jgi:hypothetical protein